MLPVRATAADGRGAIRPLPAPTGCTVTTRDAAALHAALSTARPGARICALGTMAQRLEIDRSGAPGAPIEVLGDGRTTVRGITVRADHVVVSGLNAIYPDAPGIFLRGNDDTVADTTVYKPRGGDNDGLRFWGAHLLITHNTIRGTRGIHGAHADCMQTFATGADAPASHDVRIEGNRCERIDNTCLIIEGPNSLAGDGSGQGATHDIRYSDNYCDNRKAFEALQIDDVQRLSVLGNHIAAPVDHAFALQNRTTGAIVRGNELNPRIGYQVGADASSRPGYQGPPPAGKP